MPEGLLEPRQLPPRARAMALLLLVGVLGLAIGAQIEFTRAQALREDQYEQFAFHRNAALVGDALAAAATVVLCRRLRRWRVPVWPGRRGAFAAIAVLVCIGAGLRAYRLAELPPGLWVDEALNGVQAVQIAAAGRPLVALPPEDVRTGLGAGYVDVAALAFALFDPDDGPHALRAVTAALGTAGLVALASLAWVLFGSAAAVAAAAWVAVSQWHLNYSRWGEMPIMSSLAETLVVLALVIGLRARGWRAWIAWLAAGVFLGAGLYTYQTFRLFVVLAGALAAALAVRRPRAVAAHWRPLAVALLVAGAVAAPMLRYAATEPEAFSERAQGTLIVGRDDWREQLADSIPRSLLAFQLAGDDNPRHNLPNAPLLSAVPAVLAPIGLAACLAAWRTRAAVLVPVWFVIALVPAMMTLEAPHASRLLDSIVPIALMVGVAADLVFGVLSTTLPPRLGLVACLGAGVGAALLAGVQEYRAYFVERERRPEFVDAFFPWESAPARYLAAHAPTATVFLDPTTYWNAATQFVAHRYLETLPNDVRLLRLQTDFPPAEPLARDALYLLPKPYLPVAAVIRGLWDEAHCDEQRDAFGRVDLAACRVPQAALARAPAGPARWPYGLRGRFYATADGSDTPVAEAMLAFPYCEAGLDDPPLGRFRRAEWDGFIDIAEPGTYYFRLHPDSTSLTIDGQPVIADAGEHAFGGGNGGTATLPAGRLPIRITLEPGSNGRYFLWFLWQPPHREIEIVPSTVLHPPETP